MGTQSTWGQIKNIKLHIVTDIKKLTYQPWQAVVRCSSKQSLTPSQSMEPSTEKAYPSKVKESAIRPKEPLKADTRALVENAQCPGKPWRHFLDTVSKFTSTIQWVWYSFSRRRCRVVTKKTESSNTKMVVLSSHIGKLPR